MYQPHEEGASLVEYSLILVLAVIMIVVILTTFGTQVNDIYSKVVTAVPPP